ncbi:unnamed protein product [Rotaria magnacalcarata]
MLCYTFVKINLGATGTITHDTNSRDQDPLLALHVEQTSLLVTHFPTSTTGTLVHSVPQSTDYLISSLEPNSIIENIKMHHIHLLVVIY